MCDTLLASHSGYREESARKALSFSILRQKIYTFNLLLKQQLSSADALFMEISADCYRIAIDGAGYGIFDLNVESGSLRCSGGLLTSLGYPPYKIIENIEDFETLISPIDIPRFREALQQQIRDYTPLNVDLRMLLKKGGIRWLSMKGGFQVSNTGSVFRLTAVIVDIDRYKSAETRIHKIANILSSQEEGQ